MQVIKYPGHFSFSGDKKYINMNTAKEKALEKILENEKIGSSFDINARSYGCEVLMSILLEHEFNHLDRVAFWGPVPIVQMCDVCVYGTNGVEKAKTEKGSFLN